jgi:hypothetical protein
MNNIIYIYIYLIKVKKMSVSEDEYLSLVLTSLCSILDVVVGFKRSIKKKVV